MDTPFDRGIPTRNRFNLDCVPTFETHPRPIEKCRCSDEVERNPGSREHADQAWRRRRRAPTNAATPIPARTREPLLPSDAVALQPDDVDGDVPDGVEGVAPGAVADGGATGPESGVVGGVVGEPQFKSNTSGADSTVTAGLPGSVARTTAWCWPWVRPRLPFASQDTYTRSLPRPFQLPAGCTCIPASELARHGFPSTIVSYWRSASQGLASAEKATSNETCAAEI